MNNSSPKRHIGYINNTGSPVVVVAMENPKHLGHALVIQTDTLPDQFHEYLMDSLESTAGQQSVDFYKFLEKRPSPDTNINLLESLARRNMIREEPTSNVILTPRRGDRYPLNEVLEGMKGGPQTKSGTTEINNKADSHEEKTALANNLLSQAELLISEANRKKEEAYRVAPHLRPAVQQTQSIDDLLFFNNRAEKSKVEECFEGDTCSLDNNTQVKTTLPDLSNQLGLNVDPSGTVNVTIPENKYPF